MQKINFGSFPFMNIDKKTRVCLDKYLIKTFADQVVVTDIFRNLNTAKDYFYLTPDIIIDQLYNFKSNGGAGAIRANAGQHGFVGTRGVTFQDNDLSKADPSKFFITENTIMTIKTNDEVFQIPENISRNVPSFLEEADKIDYKKEYENLKRKYESTGFTKINDPYMNIIKRSFFILRNFYRKISTDPFYRDTVYLPIYSEKLDMLNPKAQHTSQFKYSFFLLTNGLLNNIKLDEISFSDTAVVNVLFIFSQLFPDKSLYKFDDKDKDKVLKIYRFLESTRISPINFFVSVYRLMYIMNNANTINDLKTELNKITKSQLKDVINPEFILKVIEYISQQKDSKDLFKIFKKYTYNLKPDTFEKSNLLWKVIDEILKINKIESLFKNFEGSISEKYKLLNERVKYQEIITLFDELAAYNKLTSKDIIQDTNFELNFKVELNNTKVAYNDQVILQKLNMAFANFLNDSNKFINALFNKEKKKLKLDSDTAEKMISVKIKDSNINSLQERITKNEIEIQRLQREYSGASQERRLELQNIIDVKSKELMNLQAQLNAENIGYNAINSMNNTAISANADTYRYELNQINSEIARIEDKLENNLAAGDRSPYVQDLENKLAQLKQEKMDMERHLNTNKEYQSLANDTENIGNVSLEDAKTELGELYIAIKNLLGNPTGFTLFINKPILIIDDYYQRIKNHTAAVDSDEMMYNSLLSDIDLAVMDVVDVLYDNMEAQIEALYSKKVLVNPNQSFGFGAVTGATDYLKKQLSLSGIKDELYNRLILILTNRVFKYFAHAFKRLKDKENLEFTQTLQGIHPVIKRLINNPENFKSFIFNFNDLIDLYDILYLTDVQKYLIGASNKSFSGSTDMPRKYNNPKNKVDRILEDILKLKDNPIWLISKNTIWLSLPNYMSLTRSRIFGQVSKSDIQDYCKIDYKKMWTEVNMASVFNSPKDQRELQNKIKNLETKLKSIEDKLKKFGNNKKLSESQKKEKKKLQDEKNKILRDLKFLKALQKAVMPANEMQLLSGLTGSTEQINPSYNSKTAPQADSFEKTFEKDLK